MTRRCAYCGAPAAFKLTVREHVVLVTCSCCSDLPALDPAHGLADTIARDATSAPLFPINGGTAAGRPLTA